MNAEPNIAMHAGKIKLPGQETENRPAGLAILGKIGERYDFPAHSPLVYASASRLLALIFLRAKLGANFVGSDNFSLVATGLVFSLIA
jgi:hypothetical protein